MAAVIMATNPEAPSGPWLSENSSARSCLPRDGASSSARAVADGPVVDRVHGAADSRDWGVVKHDDRMPGL